MKDSHSSFTLLHRIATVICDSLAMTRRATVIASRRRGNQVHQGRGGSKAFSLIELLISLIVISLIIATFTPVLTNKLKYRELALAAKEMKINCSRFNTTEGQCLLCTETKCNLCTNSINVPEGKFVNPEEGCRYQNCSSKFGAACARCNKDYCSACKSGWGYDSSKRDTTQACKKCPPGQFSPGNTNPCTVCPGGQYQDEYEKASCKSCETYQFSSEGATACTNCNPTYGACAVCDASTCRSCEWGNKLNGINCTAVTCGVAQYVSNTSCAACDGYNQYKNKTNHADTNCDTCGAHEKANPTHTGCVCESGYEKVGGSCVSTSCPGGYWNGSSCTTCGANQHPVGTSCVCDSGFESNGSGGCKEIVAECTPTASQYKDGGECKECNTAIEHCAACSNASSCTTCENDYKLVNNSCIYDPCHKYNAIYITGGSTKFCMKKFNAGDTGGPALPATITFSGTPSENNLRCWQSGATSSDCSSYNDSFEYNPCNRTVCSWFAAVEICKSITDGVWSLPTNAQLNVLKNTLSTVQFQNPDGLQLCDKSSNTKSSKCSMGVKNSCPDSGQENKKCMAYAIWSLDVSSKQPYIFELINNSANVNHTSTTKRGSRSVRCVKTIN